MFKKFIFSAKGKAIIGKMCELEVNKLLKKLANVICNSDNHENIQKKLKHYEDLKR